MQIPPPPSHAVNRGICTEGIGCFVGALLGGGTSLTTYSENIGALSLTKVLNNADLCVYLLADIYTFLKTYMKHHAQVASRWPLQIAGVLLIVLGLFTKVGAVLATLPDPLVGAQLAISAATVAGVR